MRQYISMAFFSSVKSGFAFGAINFFRMKATQRASRIHAAIPPMMMALITFERSFTVGAVDGPKLGETVGASDGDKVGSNVGAKVGEPDGAKPSHGTQIPTHPMISGK